ncbi:dihydropteroate synthase [Streptomyces murinus]|uniref:dihydropteroate synthase n=1 Tax=Streptomyces murinus TaxID=33900 RepID=UPI003F48A383
MAAGARLVNDVSGGGDPAMVPAVAAAGVPFVVMHWRGQSIDMNNPAVYADVVGEVVAELNQPGAGRRGGIAPERIVIDPGLGFAKDAGNDPYLVAHLSALRKLGGRCSAAASRKRFLGVSWRVKVLTSEEIDLA